MPNGKDTRILMQLREEGAAVPYGISHTDTHVLGRIHINYRRSLNESTDLFVHIAIPRDTANDPTTWSVFESIATKSERGI